MLYITLVLGLDALGGSLSVGASHRPVRAVRVWASSSQRTRSLSMIRSSRWNSGVSSLVALVAAFVVTCPRARAQVIKPFRPTGAGAAQHTPPTPGDASAHVAIGEATERGRYCGEGVAQLLRFASPTTADFDSQVPFVFTAANGDELAFTYGV